MLKQWFTRLAFLVTVLAISAPASALPVAPTAATPQAHAPTPKSVTPASAKSGPTLPSARSTPAPNAHAPSGSPPAAIHLSPARAPATTTARPAARAVPPESHESVQATLNVPLAAQFPRLAIVLKDPDAFYATMSERFEKQKQLTPNDPHRFDYSEIGIPIVKDTRAALKTKLDELTAGTVGRSPEARKVAIQHLTALAKEADGYLAIGTVSYRSLIEYCHFYTRAIGQFDKETFPAFKRAFLKIDERLEGFKARSPEEELADYQARRFTVFQQDTKTTSKGFAAAESAFEDAVFNKKELKTLLVPTNDDLTDHLLMRLGSRDKINLVGVSDKPILADGFLRPSGMFWVHDLRHQSAKFHKKQVYLDDHAIPTAKVRAMNELMDKFYVELRGEIDAVPDPQLREALKLLTFNFYFDRGFPMMPSTFLGRKGDNITLGLYLAEKVGGQGVKFNAPVKNLGRAEEWLKQFWDKRSSIETQFLADKGS